MEVPSTRDPQALGKVQPLNPSLPDAVEARGLCCDSIENLVEGGCELLGHLISLEVRIGQEEGLNAALEEDSPLLLPIADAGVLHQHGPVSAPGEFEPFHIGYRFVRRRPIVLGQGDDR